MLLPVFLAYQVAIMPSMPMPLYGFGFRSTEVFMVNSIYLII